MTSRPTVSVALCTYNGSRYLKQQVQSILDQTEPAAQVVVSDDASGDDSVVVVEQMWAKLNNSAPKLVVLRNQRPLGVTKNFQQAAESCTSDLIALSDQDDVWAPDRLQRMVDVFESSPGLGLLFSDARLVDADGRDLGPSLFEALEVRETDLSRIRSGNAFEVLLRRNLVTGATVVFRRTLLGAALPFDSAWVHDEWLAIVASAVTRVDCLPEKLLDYRQHGGNAIGVHAPTWGYKMRRMMEPRACTYSVLTERADHLRLHLEKLNVNANVLTDVTGKVKHQKFREGLPSNRMLRIIPVAREAAAGRYASFSSRGNLDVLRDLLQPAARACCFRAGIGAGRQAEARGRRR